LIDLYVIIESLKKEDFIMCLISCSSTLRYSHEKIVGVGLDGSSVVSVYVCTKCGKEHIKKEAR
jgi:hypothetical protein